MSILHLKPKYFFGDCALNEAENDIKAKKYKKALILYGKGSVKTNGSYTDLVNFLKRIKLDYVEFSGIEPNPRNTTIDKCIKFTKTNKVDVIFALGGGSVVDASKVIGILTTNRNYKSCWNYCLDSSKIKHKSLDIIAIITLAGTASENNMGSVITNSKTKEKKAVFTPSAIPIFTIMNPTYTYTVNKWQTASGIFDCFSHLLEQYFAQNTFTWTKNYLFGCMKTLIKYAKFVLQHPTDYEARSNILWTTTMALNGIADFNSDSDWAVHTIEHAFSGLYDITHGAGLAFVTPTYLYLKSIDHEWFRNKVIAFGNEVFNVNGWIETIETLLRFIISIGLPTRWSKFKEIKKITDKDIDFLIKHASKYNESTTDNKFLAKVIKQLATLR